MLLTDSAAADGRKARRMRRNRRGVLLGRYHRAWAGNKAWIEIVVDRIVPTCPKYLVWLQKASRIALLKTVLVRQADAASVALDGTYDGKAGAPSPMTHRILASLCSNMSGKVLLVAPGAIGTEDSEFDDKIIFPPILRQDDKLSGTPGTSAFNRWRSP